MQNDEFVKNVEDLEADSTEKSAVKVYTALLPQFDIQLRIMGKRSIQRVMNALIKTPLLDSNTLIGDQEKNLYTIASRLMEAKLYLVHSVMAKQELEEGKLNESVPDQVSIDEKIV